MAYKVLVVPLSVLRITIKEFRVYGLMLGTDVMSTVALILGGEKMEIERYSWWLRQAPHYWKFAQFYVDGYGVTVQKCTAIATLLAVTDGAC